MPGADTHTDPTGDATLLADAGDGDERAAARLYAGYADALYGYGLHHLGDPELAEELVQRVLERAWRRARSYDPSRGPVRAFVFAIARSTVLDLRRAAARRPRPSDRLGEGAEPAPDEADQLLLATIVRTALERLTTDHRRVLELAYLHGLTQAEIAQRLQLPLGTVKSRTYEALRSLRVACEELGVRP